MYVRREEGIERAGTQMEILHQAEQPGPLITARLSKSFHHADGLHRVTDAVPLDACVC